MFLCCCCWCKFTIFFNLAVRGHRGLFYLPLGACLGYFLTRLSSGSLAWVRFCKLTLSHFPRCRMTLRKGVSGGSRTCLRLNMRIWRVNGLPLAKGAYRTDKKYAVFWNGKTGHVALSRRGCGAILRPSRARGSCFNCYGMRSLIRCRCHVSVRLLRWLNRRHLTIL